MLDLAHVTDLHLVESNHAQRRGADWQRLYYLNVGRAVDPAPRKRRAIEALRMAGRNARHVCVTGDLTEDGIDSQFEVLAEVLAESGVDPERVTLVPGNHDRYSEPDAYERALQGPLRAYAPTSRCGRPFELSDDALLMPISTASPQSWLRSAGWLSSDDARRIDWLAAETRRAGKLALVALHHPPQGYRNQAWNWLNGLQSRELTIALLSRHARLHMLHGHTHSHESVQFAPGRLAQAHSAAATVERADSVRYYQVTREALLPVALACEPRGLAAEAGLELGFAHAPI
jgi:3',5'-cyclic-AMP phosphodiesterase